MGNFLLSKAKGGGFAIVLGLIAAGPAGAAVFNFDQGLAFNKGGANPNGFNFTVLHTANHSMDASGTTTHKLDADVDPLSLPPSVQADLDPAFNDDMGGSLTYSIDNGVGGSGNITDSGALNGAVVSLGSNSFHFNGKNGRPDGTLTLSGSFSLTSTSAFSGDQVDTPFGLAEPQYKIGGTDLHFDFTYDAGSHGFSDFSGTFALMSGTMGPFNGLAVGTSNRPEDVTFYIWAASTQAIDCNGCSYQGKHFAMDFSGWGTSVPEPSAIALLIAGFAGVVSMRRRKVAA